MEMTAAAAWLNQAFALYDHAILGALHQLAIFAQGALTPFFRFVSLLADHGLGPLLLGLVLMAFQRTRRAGCCVFLGVFLGALATNVLLKDLVARPRPFADATSQYWQWWRYVGMPQAGGLSFPSGHTTATTAAMTALFLCGKGKKRYLALLPPLVMGMSRNYLMVHYPSDVLAGLAVGIACGLLACLVVKRHMRVAD